MIYIAKLDGGDHVKIGWSVRPNGRITELQTGVPTKLTMLRTIEGPKWGERWLHHRFLSHHLRGEWFRFDEAMMSITLPIEKPVKPIPLRVRKRRFVYPQVKRCVISMPMPDPVGRRIKVAAYSRGMDVGEWLLEAAMTALHSAGE